MSATTYKASMNLTISSLEIIVSLMKANPLLSTLPALQSLRPLLQLKSLTGCCNKSIDLQPYRRAFESSLRALTEEQKTKMKEILKADKITYFAKSAVGQLEKVTF